MTVKGGTSPACAVCKFQRRKCKADCVLAPHFPANQVKAFQNVHRLFGVSNIMKILKELNTDEQKEEAMKSIKYESDMRQRYPVYGCAGIICQLRQQLSQSIEELHHVYAQLAVLREQYNNNSQMHSPPSSLQLGMGSNAPIFNAQQPSTTQHHSDPFMINQFFGPNEFDDHFLMDSSHLAKDLMGLEHNYYDLSPNNSLIGTQPHHSHHIFNSDSAVEVGPAKQVYEADGHSEFSTFADDRQSYIETKEDCESSSDSFSQASKDQVCNNDLKNAAACFSLTNTS